MFCLIGLVLYWVACFGGEVVELEPVQALNFQCQRLGSEPPCSANPFCYWKNTECINDPCLLKYNRTLSSSTDTCEMTDGVSCDRRTLSSITGHDCYKGDVDTGIICAAATNINNKPWDYCAYAYIRDQACPRSICKIADAADISVNKVGCIPYNTPGTVGVFSGCQMLAEADCKLVPKCYWNTSGTARCVQDPCLEGTDKGDKDCATWPGDGTISVGDCVTFKPLKKQSTDIVNYCIYKDNKEPNICYFAGRNDSSATDNGATYPTYNFGSQDPECYDQLGDCEGTADCYTTFNTVGALAGQYCTDGKHGSANVLRIPSMLVFLILSALSIVSIL